MLLGISIGRMSSNRILTLQVRVLRRWHRTFASRPDAQVCAISRDHNTPVHARLVTPPNKVALIINPFVIPGSSEDSHRLESSGRTVEHAKCRASGPRREPRVFQNDGSLWRCTDCGEYKFILEFYSNGQGGLRPYCKLCTRVRNLQRRQTLRGYLMRLMHSAKSSSKRRAERGRQEAGTFNLEYADLLTTFMAQQGRCAYSGVVLEMLSYTDWQCTLERVNPASGYDKDNFVFIAYEFQTQRQWSRSKVLALNRILTLDDGARVQMDRTYSLDVDKMLRKLLCNAQVNSKKKFGRVLEVDVGLMDLRTQFISQSGRCHYSQVPLALGWGVDWQISLERLDNTRGYVSSNVALIALEFQSSDYSARSAHPASIHGSPQWSASKFAQFVDFVSHPCLQNWLGSQDVTAQMNAMT